jgi:hypothetical protein
MYRVPNVFARLGELATAIIETAKTVARDQNNGWIDLVSVLMFCLLIDVQ